MLVEFKVIIDFDENDEDFIMNTSNINAEIDLKLLESFTYSYMKHMCNEWNMCCSLEDVTIISPKF